MSNFEWWKIKHDEGELAEADSVIKRIEKKEKEASIHDWNISREYLDHTWLGTYSKQEMIELQRHIIHLIGEKYSYRDLEDYLITLGYNEDMVRDAFQRITGADPREMEIKVLPNAPGTIPGINYGWGVSKDKKYNYYFIMPYVYGYSIFGQKGDTQRDEVFSSASLEKCKEELGKMVKGISYWLPQPLNTDIIKELPVHPVPEKQTPFSSQAEISEELENKIEKVQETPFEDIVKERSPQEFFEKEKMPEDKGKMGEAIQSVIEHIRERDQAIPAYDIKITSFKYLQEEVEREIEKTPSIPGEKVKEYFSNEGIITVLLTFKKRDLPEDKGVKQGFMIFALVDSKITTTDSFKGEDNKDYALTEEGLNAYFAQETGEYEVEKE